jgi:hypothetical protein
MHRFFVVAALLTSASTVICADEAVVRLNIQPMAAPRPALKYTLLPEVRELSPGNPAQWYIRCFAEQRNFFFSKGANAERSRYLALPLAELPLEKLDNYGGNALRQADWGARSDALDWQIIQRVQTDGLDLMQPELESLRILAAGLKVRFRAEVAGKRFDDAIGTAKTMFGLARHLGEHPTEQANRIGLAIAELALGAIEEMVQQPGCPNLYWALTDLPCPLVDLRKGIQGQHAMVATEMRAILDDRPMTDAQIEKVMNRLSGIIGFAREQAGRSPRSLRAEVAMRTKDLEKLKAARRTLVERGMTHEAVQNSPFAQFMLARNFWEWTIRTDAIQKFPPAQVVLAMEKSRYESSRDEAAKLLGLPLWQMDKILSNNDSSGLFADLLPNIVKVRVEQGSLEQRIALLRLVEALRLHAAAHDGRLPEKWDELSVPGPDDPFTGKAFQYKVDSQTAHLRGGNDKLPTGNVHYEINLRILK